MIISLFRKFSVLFFSPLLWAQDWRTADRSPLGIAPLPKDEPRAVVQIYYARAFAWRGYFGVHPWVAVKRENANEFEVYEVVGFRRTTGIQVVRNTQRPPDSRWFGNDPVLLYDLRGPAAEKMIPKIEEAVKSYPYQTSYRLWPGPNSNTFVSYVIRNTPGIAIELPPHAIGKDWINEGDLFGLSESKTGIQVSLFGALGFTLGLAEGIEINILGMTFGVDFWTPAIKLPFIGRIGFPDRALYIPSAKDKPVAASTPESKSNLN